MSIAANHPTGPVLTPGTAQATLREMASVIRTVFGVGLQASRRTAVAAAEAAASAPQLTATQASPAGPMGIAAQPTVASTGAPAAPASIPMPDLSAGIPMPGIAVPGITLDEADTADEQPAAVQLPEAEEPEAEASAYTAPTLTEVPPLAPVPAPIEPRQPETTTLSTERRQALLQELAFLDD